MLTKIIPNALHLGKGLYSSKNSRQFIRLDNQTSLESPLMVVKYPSHGRNRLPGLGNANSALPADIERLVTKIKKLPKVYQEQVAEEVEDTIRCSKRRKRILELTMDSLSTARHTIQHLLFNLNATENERDAKEGG